MDLKPTDKVDGMIEIGYPGRLNMTGKMTIVNDV